jgi:hypothetical protein
VCERGEEREREKKTRRVDADARRSTPRQPARAAAVERALSSSLRVRAKH